MKMYPAGEYDLYVGDPRTDLGIASSSNVQELISQAVDPLFHACPLYSKYVAAYGARLGIGPSAVLIAHGGTNAAGEWVITDEYRTVSIQSWIDEADGRYAAIIFRVCNPGRCIPVTLQSLLFVPFGAVYTEASDLNCYYLVDPFVGEVSPYTIEHDLSKLRRRS